MAIAGLVRARKHQFGRQASMGTKVSAKRAYGFSGVPSPDRGWTDPEVDAGAIDPVVDPFLTGGNHTASLTDPSVRYNTLPLFLAGFFGGGVTPTGAGDAKTWVWEPASDGSDEIDPFTYEFGDDVPDDWDQYGDSIIETLEITGPDGLGALTASMSWAMGSFASSGSTDHADSPSVPTSLTLPIEDAVVYLKDGKIDIASDPDDLGTSQVSDALHTFTLRLSREMDKKRFANGAQTFDVNAYATAKRLIELESTFAKTSDIVGTGSETDAWMSDTAIKRYVQLAFESTLNIETGPDVPYSWVSAMPLRYYTREHGAIGGNSTVVLTGRAFLEAADFGGVFTSTVVNSLASAGL